MKVYKKIDPEYTISYIKEIRNCLGCSLYEAKKIIDLLKITDKPVEILDIVDCNSITYRSIKHWEMSVYGKLIDSEFIVDSILMDDIDKLFEI